MTYNSLKEQKQTIGFAIILKILRIQILKHTLTNKHLHAYSINIYLFTLFLN